MTILEIRALLGLGPEISDAAVVEAYAVHIGAASALQTAVGPILSLEAAKRQLVVDFDSDDVLIGELLDAAVDEVERATGMYLLARPFAAYADEMGGFIDLSPWPIRSIDAVIYLDAAGIDQVLAPSEYRLASGTRPARIMPTGRWPRASVGRGAVTVTGVAGFQAPEDVPPACLQAVRVILAEYYANREAGALSEKTARNVRWILRHFRVKRL